MKLVTAKGEFELPADFSFTVELNNAFFSDDGDATIPATLPASRNIFTKLGHPERLGKADKFMRKIPARIEAGVFHKNGQLIIDSVHRHDGVVASLAIENSDLYSQYKEKKLSEILYGLARTDFENVSDWAAYLQDVYRGSVIDSDFDLFPVAVNYKEDDGIEMYQILNEPNLESEEQLKPLIWESKIIDENGVNVVTPEGYSITVFLRFQRFLEILFEQMDYTLVMPLDGLLSHILLLNNCADTICKGYIKYADLVPDITLSELIEFLNAKFHAQLRVLPESKKAYLLLFEQIIAETHDNDIGAKLDGDFLENFSNSKRVVLSSGTSLEGAAPAAETLDLLLEKYGFYIEMSEAEFNNNNSNIDALILRKSIGQFYETRRYVDTGEFFYKKIGSCYFKYDRQNSDETEEYNAEDEIPPMVSVAGMLMPYVGDKLNRNTTMNKQEERFDGQKLILCNQKRFASWYRYGSILNADSQGIGTYDETNKDLTIYETFYEKYWKRYNEILLNNTITLTGKIDYSISELMQFNMYALKFYKGQLLLPKTLSYEIGNRISCNESEFILLKNYIDMIVDKKPINPENPILLKWIYNESEMLAIKTHIETGGIDVPDRSYFLNWLDPFIVYTDNYNTDVFLGIPEYKEEKRYMILRKADFKYSRRVRGEFGGWITLDRSSTFEFYTWYDAVEA